MKYIVLKDFYDRFDNMKINQEKHEHTPPNEERANQLIKLGFIKVVEDDSDTGNPIDLDSNVEKIKEAVTAELSKEKLEVLLKMEVEGKKRKTVIEHIESLLKGDSDGKPSE
ncbi:hypothetical protein KHA94_16280 [Bacillus sp. FJAT-49705]|uniref:Uncharacterized protein n=1 Tax=Cytobacillus citreus TaxID=2833586 RepID=A0ABS5NX71_9BACI|nr:hypothetical protein [Cytobacillus citreus]MBS4191748.1 hypothetical protein [Cytobacillus citreus]